MEPKNNDEVKVLLESEMRYEWAIEYTAIRLEELKRLIDKQSELVRCDLEKRIKEESFNIDCPVSRYVEREFFVKNSPIECIDWRYVNYSEEDVIAYQEQTIAGLSDVISAYDEATHRLMPS